MSLFNIYFNIDSRDIFSPIISFALIFSLLFPGDCCLSHAYLMLNFLLHKITTINYAIIEKEMFANNYIFWLFNKGILYLILKNIKIHNFVILLHMQIPTTQRIIVEALELTKSKFKRYLPCNTYYGEKG